MFRLPRVPLFRWVSVPNGGAPQRNQSRRDPSLSQLYEPAAGSPALLRPNQILIPLPPLHRRLRQNRSQKLQRDGRWLLRVQLVKDWSADWNGRKGVSRGRRSWKKYRKQTKEHNTTTYAQGTQMVWESFWSGPGSHSWHEKVFFNFYYLYYISWLDVRFLNYDLTASLEVDST